ncbi:ATPase domain-containing protein [Microvirga massiliensis]|uniref:ATPase domain-containing protein n=1 Tax=Microvirga massiliensis TaxID=1033741 RepID=UPI00062BCBCD|nr:ATPase domain-containing protein [Microvirga massiliensis]
MSDHDSLELERVPSGIPGLDTILRGGLLRGGLLRGGVYIVQGVPGAGKTIFANQVCFYHTARGRRAVFATLLAESHARMLQHLRSLSFFDETVIPERMIYVSAFQALESDGLKGLFDLLRREVRGHRADFLVVDGFLAVEDVAPSAGDLKKFISELQSIASIANCTVLLLTNGTGRAVCPEQTMVDGVIELEDQIIAPRAERYLRVRKFRGSGFLRGHHGYRITDGGLEVFPRVEAAFATPSRADEYRPDRMRTGVPSLDEMLLGGLPVATTTALIGPTGSGKSTLGLQFLSLSNPDEPGLIFGFYETPQRLRSKAASFGIDLAGLEARGAVEIVWQAQGENRLDELGHRLLDAVRRRGVKRLFVDGLGGMIQSAAHPDRITRFFAVLANELRALGITTVYTLEMEGVYGEGMTIPVAGISSLIENLIMLRRVEIRSRMHRSVSILKLRDSDFDMAVRDFSITRNGIAIGPPLEEVK